MKHNLLPQPPRTNYISDSDELILEDELQRIMLEGKIDKDVCVTGQFPSLRDDRFVCVCLSDDLAVTNKIASFSCGAKSSYVFSQVASLSFMAPRKTLGSSRWRTSALLISLRRLPGLR